MNARIAKKRLTMKRMGRYSMMYPPTSDEMAARAIATIGHRPKWWPWDWHPGSDRFNDRRPAMLLRTMRKAGRCCSTCLHQSGQMCGLWQDHPCPADPRSHLHTTK